MLEPAPGGIHLGRILAGQAHPSVVYFLAMPYGKGQAVKIGTSTRLLLRVSSVSYAATLTDVLLLLPGGKETETALHRKFQAYQIEEFRELFWLKGQLKDFLGWAPPRPPLKTRLRRRLSLGHALEIDPEPEPEIKPVEAARVVPVEPTVIFTAPSRPGLATLREACDDGILQFAGADPLAAARKAAQRPGFPAPVPGVVAEDGKSALYHRPELAEWQEGKVRVLRREAS